MSYLDWTVIVVFAIGLVLACVWTHIIIQRIDAEFYSKAKQKLEALHKNQAQALERKWRP